MKMQTLEEAVRNSEVGSTVKWATRPNREFSQRHKGEILSREELKHGVRFEVLDHSTYEVLHVVVEKGISLFEDVG